MDLNTYQRLAHVTASKDLSTDWTNYTVLGLAGEAGEIANKWKKVFRDNGGQVTNSIKLALADELGDVLWYVAELAGRLGYTLEDIAARNIEKLAARQQAGTISGAGDNR